MRFFVSNLIDETGVTITGSSQASAYLTASNVAHEHKEKVWRTGTSGATETVTFDLGSAQSATSVIVFNTDLTNSDSNVQLRASTDNFGASDVLIASLTYSSSYSYRYATFSTASYRYWRLTFTKSSAGETRDVGRIFIGDYTDLDNVIAFDGVSIKRTDLSAKSRSAGGQTYTDRRGQFRKGQLELNSISNTQKDALAAITNETGTHQSFFLQIDRNSSTELSEVLYVKLSDLPESKSAGIDSDVAWDVKLEFEEML